VEQSKGVITNYWGKDPADARWKDAPDFKETYPFDRLPPIDKAPRRAPPQPAGVARKGA
jgi:hypothetical protein